MIRALAVVLVVAAVAAGAFLLSGGAEDPPTYKIQFDNAFGVVEGGDFKVSGARVGKVASFDLTDEFPPRAEVTVQVDAGGVRSLRADARCVVRPQSLIGEYFVNCEPGQADERIPDGGTVPVEQTSSTIPLDVVQNILRRPYRERLRIILMTLGAGLAGRPEDLNEVLRRAHPGLRETTETLEILARQQDIIERFVADSDTVIAALARNERDVVRFVRESARTAEVTASRREDLARSLDRLPVFLAELEPTMERLGALANAQIPVLRNLQEAAPDLERTFRLLEPFSRRAEPALVALGDLSGTGSAAIRESRDEIDTLRRVARRTPQLTDPLRKFLQSIDTRERATERDERAAESAPPAPDKTASRPGRGFTGMEALLNYFFWQTLAINGFDQISHVLRFVAILDHECSPYTAQPTPEQLERCTSWLGPYQPGVNAPDPTEGGAGRAARVANPEARTGDAPYLPPAQRGDRAAEAALDYLLSP
jgi:virulence factor Mce-like protein